MPEKIEKPSKSESENEAKKLKEKRAKMKKDIDELQEELKKQKISI